MLRFWEDLDISYNVLPEKSISPEECYPLYEQTIPNFYFLIQNFQNSLNTLDHP